MQAFSKTRWAIDGKGPIKPKIKIKIKRRKEREGEREKT
jgi:hypothetical protein